MTPAQIITEEQEIVKQKILDALDYFNKQTGLSIQSISLIETHIRCGRYINIELTYNEIKHIS